MMYAPFRYGANPFQQWQNYLLASAPAGYPNASFYQPMPRQYAPTSPFPIQSPQPYQSLLTQMVPRPYRRLPLLPYGGYPQGRGMGPFSPFNAPRS